MAYYQQGLAPTNNAMIQTTQTPGINDANLARSLATDGGMINSTALTGGSTALTGGIKPTLLAATSNMVQPTQQQSYQPVTSGSQNYGLAGAESALQGGFQGGLNALNQGGAQSLGTLQQANQLSQGQLLQGQNALGNYANVDTGAGQSMFSNAANGVNQYSNAGLQAQGVQSALSGAQGQEAFDQAFIDSPVQQFLREQGELGVVNQAAALGGLGGGRVQQALTQYGQGLAGTQLQSQIDNLSNLSNQGLNAASQAGQFMSTAGQTQANLAAQNAQMQNSNNQAQANLYGQGASLTSNLMSQAAGNQYNTGTNTANMYNDTAGQLAGYRSQAGRDLASQIGQSTSTLSGYQDAQGSYLADLLGSSGGNIADLLQNYGLTGANQDMQLGTNLGNVATGQGSALSGITLNQGNNAANTALQQGQNTTNLIGNLAGAYGYYNGSQP